MTKVTGSVFIYFCLDGGGYIPPELYVCWNFNSYKTDHVVFGLYVYFVRHVTTGVRFEIP